MLSVEVALNSQHRGCLHRQNFFLSFFFLNCMLQRAKGHRALGKTTQTPTHKLQHKPPCESLSQRAYDPAMLRPHFKDQRKGETTRMPSEKNPTIRASSSFVATTTTTTPPESGAAAGVVGQSGAGTEGQGGTHAAELLSPVFFF